MDAGSAGVGGWDGRELQVFGPPETVLDALSQCDADTLVFTGGPALERIRDLAWRLEGSGVDVFAVPTDPRGDGAG